MFTIYTISLGQHIGYFFFKLRCMGVPLHPISSAEAILHPLLGTLSGWGSTVVINHCASGGRGFQVLLLFFNQIKQDDLSAAWPCFLTSSNSPRHSQFRKKNSFFDLPAFLFPWNSITTIFFIIRASIYIYIQYLIIVYDIIQPIIFALVLKNNSILQILSELSCKKKFHPKNS